MDAKISDMKKEIDLGFTKIQIYNGYVVGRTEEGVQLSIDKHLQVLDAVNQYFSSPYGLVLDEVNSYSVDFPVMMHVRDDPNIACIGVVCHRLTTKIALSIGKVIINKPVMFSSNYEEIENWVQKQVG